MSVISKCPSLCRWFRGARHYVGDSEVPVTMSVIPRCPSLCRWFRGAHHYVRVDTKRLVVYPNTMAGVLMGVVDGLQIPVMSDFVRGSLALRAAWAVDAVILPTRCSCQTGDASCGPVTTSAYVRCCFVTPVCLWTQHLAIKCAWSSFSWVSRNRVRRLDGRQTFVLCWQCYPKNLWRYKVPPYSLIPQLEMVEMLISALWKA